MREAMRHGATALGLLTLVFVTACESEKSFSSDAAIAQNDPNAPNNGGIDGYDPNNPDGTTGSEGTDGDTASNGPGGTSGTAGTNGSGTGGSGNGSNCAPSDLDVKFEGAVQECFDSNRIWDFNRGLCTSALRSSFNCDYAALAAAINAAGMNTPAKLTAANGKAKLIACGEKNESKTIIAQWVYPPSGTECEYTLQDGLPVTGCYRITDANAPKLDKSDPAAVQAFVNACLDN